MEAIWSGSPGAYERCFQRYGMDLDAKRRFQVTLPDGRVLVGGLAARHVQTSVKHVGALSAAGMDPDVQTAQIRFAAARKIDAMLAHVLSARGKSTRLGELLTATYAVAVMTDRAVGTGENGTREAAEEALAAYVKAHSDADFSMSEHRDAAGSRVLSAIESLNPRRASKYASLSRDSGSFAG